MQNLLPRSRTLLRLALPLALCGSMATANAGLLGSVLNTLLDPLTSLLQRTLSVDYSVALTGQSFASHGQVCRALDHKLRVQRTSYGSESPRMRQQLNDCTPEALFTKPVTP